MRSHRANAAPLRLFCFPYAGGGPGIYREWPGTMPTYVDVRAVELPGRERLFNEAPIRSLVLLVEWLVDWLDGSIDDPFCFFGHSLGALLAFEVARRLRADGRRGPELLLVSGHRAPHLPDTRKRVHDLPDSEFIEELVKLEGTPPEVLGTPGLLELHIPTLRADFALAETYRYVPSAPLDCEIVGFAGTDDTEMDEADLTAWSEHTRGRFRYHIFPGGHFFLHTASGSLLPKIVEELQALYEPEVSL